MARVTFFAFDISEAAQIRRIESVRSIGHEVQSFSFRRANMNGSFAPPWANVDLGRTDNGRLFRRLGKIVGGIATSLRHRTRLAKSDVWIARNLDLLLVAWVVRLCTFRRDVTLVYECLDIHSVMTRGGAVGAAMRRAERFLLTKSDLVILSSTGFLRNYFAPVQGRSDGVALIENKLWFGRAALLRPTEPRQAEGPLVLGWVGSLRCAESFALLSEVARRMEGEVNVLLRGNVHRHALPDFDAVLRDSPNMRYVGPYDYPEGLAEVYGACDLVWSQDMWQAGTNSDWLLPNRIYEASYFGCPSVALSSTETGRRIARDGLGFTLDAPSADELEGMLRTLDRPRIAAVSRHILGMPDSAFRLFPEELEAALKPVLDKGESRGVAPGAQAALRHS